jgi:hypothetical protein
MDQAAIPTAVRDAAIAEKNNRNQIAMPRFGVLEKRFTKINGAAVLTRSTYSMRTSSR